MEYLDKTQSEFFLKKFLFNKKQGRGLLIIYVV